jgi:hypothetical protein
LEFLNMAKEKKENAPVSGSDEPETGKPAAPADAPVLAARLSVQLDDHGAIAWDRMRPETQAKLRQAIGTTGTVTGGPHVAQVSTGAGFPPELCGVLYDSLSVLLVGLARRSGYTQTQAAGLAFTADERAQLVPPTIAVLNKYNTSLGKYQEEIVLGVLVTTVLSGKLAILRATEPAAPVLVRQGEQGMMRDESQEGKTREM